MAHLEMSKEEEDYLKQEEIGMVIAKGMAKLYRAKPQDPVDYLGKWLLNIAEAQKLQNAAKVQEHEVAKAQALHDQQSKEQSKVHQKAENEAKQQEDKRAQFTKGYQKAHNLTDQLQNLTDHMKEETGATAVYIGKVLKPYNQIKEEDNDRAHLADESTQPVVRFIYADSEHQYIVDKTLNQETGLTFDVFKDPEVDPEAEAEAKKEAEPEFDEEGNEIPKELPPPKEVLPVSLLVKEVVREPRIHFFKVPRLGSYMAIRLEYESCLYEEAFDIGVDDMVQVKAKRLAQEEEKLNFETHQKEAKEEAENLGEEFTPEERTWEPIETQPYNTRKVQFVVCINTLGQDRTFSEDQQMYVKRTVQKFRDQWEATERTNLEKDIAKKVTAIEADRYYKEHHEALDQTEMEQRCEALNAPKEGDNYSEEQRAFNLLKHKYDVLTRMFYDPENYAAHLKQVEKDKIRASAGDNMHKSTEGEESQAKYYPMAPEQFKQDLIGLKQFTVIKYSRVLQTLFYMLGYTREDICQRDTNALDFAKAKDLLNEKLFRKMGNYKPVGPRDGDFKKYQKIAFLRRNISEMQFSGPTAEAGVEDYMLVMGKLLKWINMALDIRCDDVVSRRNQKEWLKMDRQAQEDASIARQAKYTQMFEEAKGAWEEKLEAEIQLKAADAAAAIDDSGDELEEKQQKARDAVLNAKRPSFDEVSFKAAFDEENPKVEIPPEVIDDIDNDYDLPYNPPNQAQKDE